jgi:hypothetical protein
MKYCLIILFLAIFTNVFSENPLAYTVMCEKGLNLRIQPDPQSEILEILPFGSMIYSHHAFYSKTRFKERYKSYEINGIKGYWIDAEYRGKKGYVFSPYLYLGENIIKDISDNEIRVTLEGVCLGEMDYHPDLKWYGLYSDSTKCFIKKVNVSMHLTTVESKEKFKGYECLGEDRIILLTDVEEKSIILIGTTNEWQEGDLRYNYYSKEIDNWKNEGFLYPEQELNLFFQRSNNYLHAYESVSVDSMYKITRQYQLDYIFKDRFKKDSEETTLTIYPPNPNPVSSCFISARDHAKFKSPKLFWAGDLNYDYVLDLILYQSSMNLGGGGAIYYTLFLSEIINDEIHIKQIDFAVKVYCYG